MFDPHPSFFPVSIGNKKLLMFALDPSALGVIMGRIPTSFIYRRHPDFFNFPVLLWSLRMVIFRRVWPWRYGRCMDLGRLTGPVQALGNGCSQDKGTCTDNYAFKHIVVVMAMVMPMAAAAMFAGSCLGKSGKYTCYEYGCCCKGDVFFHGVLLGLVSSRPTVSLSNSIDTEHLKKLTKK